MRCPTIWLTVSFEIEVPFTVAAIPPDGEVLAVLLCSPELQALNPIMVAAPTNSMRNFIDIIYKSLKGNSKSWF
jgi:hypothetical protein